MATLLTLHVVVSLVAIVAGLVMAAGLLGTPPRHRASTLFLWTTILTSVSGFPLPADRILPSHVVGAISLVLLAGRRRGVVPAPARRRVGPSLGRDRRWRRST